MNRRALLVGAGSLMAWPLACRGAAARLGHRIGVLIPKAEDDAEGRARVAAFVDGLHEVGLNEGRDLRIDYRWGGTDVERLRTLASELVALAPDVLLAESSLALRALRRATTTIPIIFVLISDPVGQGFVESLAHPGANITGFSNFEFSMIGKWTQFLMEIAPVTKRIAVIFNPDTAPYMQGYLPAFEDAARSFASEPVIAPVRGDAEIESAVAALAQSQGGLIVMSDPFTTVHSKAVVSLTTKYRVPLVSPYRLFTAEGGLMSYGADIVDLYRRSAAYVKRVLSGARSGDLPVQEPTKFELVINLKTAKALGLTVPQSLRARADEVIE